MGLCRAVLMEKKDALSTTRPTIKCGNMDLAIKNVERLDERETITCSFVEIDARGIHRLAATIGLETVAVL